MRISISTILCWGSLIGCRQTHVAGGTLGDQELVTPSEPVFCNADSCSGSLPGCAYLAVAHSYGERFSANDGCNDCVCAMRGLACTRRACAPQTPLAEQSAILLESDSEPCGDDQT